MRLRVLHVARQIVIMGQKMMSSGFFLWCTYSMLCTCGIPTLTGSRVDGAAFGALFVKRLIGKVRINQVLRGNPQRLEISAEDGFTVYMLRMRGMPMR